MLKLFILNETTFIDRSRFNYDVHNCFSDLVSTQSRAKNSISVPDSVRSKSSDDLDLFLLSQ